MQNTISHIVLDAAQLMKPQPSRYEMIRIGGNCDGAYLIPDDLVGLKTCFSPGVSNQKSFEDELTDRYGMFCHMCDYSSDLEKFKTPLREGKQTFRKKWLDVDGAEDSVTLENWINELEEDDSQDLLLQMDIEGAEYRNLLNTSDTVLARFRIVLIEFHFLHDPGVVEKELLPVLRKLDELFVCVHAHPNNTAKVHNYDELDFNWPSLIELTYIRRDRLGEDTGSHLHIPLIPHPLDIANKKRLPPIFLNEAWCFDGGRATESIAAIKKAQVDYIDQTVVFHMGSLSQYLIARGVLKFKLLSYLLIRLKSMIKSRL